MANKLRFFIVFLLLSFVLLLTLSNKMYGQCTPHPCTPTPCPPPDSATIAAGDLRIHHFNSMLFRDSYIEYDTNGIPHISYFMGDTLRIQCGMIYRFYVEANGIYEWNTDISYGNVPTHGNDQLRTKITLFYDDFQTSAVVSDRAVNSTVPGNAAAGLSWRANYTGVVGIMVNRGDRYLNSEDFCACTPDTILLRFNQRRRADEDAYIVWGRYGVVRNLVCNDDNHFIYDSGTNSQQDDASGDYSNNENGYLVLYPGDLRSKLKIWGNSLMECGDTLFIYNGDITLDSTLVPYDTITGPGSHQLGNEDEPEFMSATPGQPITLRMQSDSTCTSGGFELQAKCCQTPGLPLNLYGYMNSDTTAFINWIPGEGNDLTYNWDIYTASDSSLVFSGTTSDTFQIINGLNPNECYFYTISVYSNCTNENATDSATSLDVVYSNVFCYSYFVTLGDSVQNFIVMTDSVYIPGGAYIDSTNACGCAEPGTNTNIIIHETNQRVCYGESFYFCYNFSINAEIQPVRKRLVWQSPYTLHIPNIELDSSYIANDTNTYIMSIPGEYSSGCYTTGPITEDGFLMLTAYTEGHSVTRAIIHFHVDTLPDVTLWVNDMDTSWLITCEGEPLDLTAHNNLTYNWTALHDTLSSRITHRDEITIFTPTRNGWVYLRGTDDNGCVSYDTLKISINPMADLNSVSEYTLCYGDSLLMRASGLDHYVWQKIDTLRWDSTYTRIIQGINGSEICSTIRNINSENGIVLVQQTQPNLNRIDTFYVDELHDSGFHCPESYSGISKRFKVTVVQTDHLIAFEYTTLQDGAADSLWVQPFQDADYRVLGTDSNGCRNRTNAYIHVSVLPKPKISDIYGTSYICEQDTAFFKVNMTDEETNYSFEWREIGADNIIGQENLLSIIPDSSCTYQLRVIHPNGCDTILYFPVHLYPQPEIEITAEPGVICPRSSSTLHASGATIVSWLWDDSTTTNIRIVEPQTAMEYFVTGTDGNGCSTTKSVPLTILPSPEHEILSNDSICANSSKTLVLSGRALNYQWHNPDIEVSVSGDTAIVTPSTTTVYTVSYENEYGCTDTTRVTIAVFEFPMPELSPDITICRNDSTVLQASGGLFFRWDDPDHSTTDSIVVAPVDTTTYHVFVYDYIGCGSYGEVTVNVIPYFPLSIVSSADSICPNSEVTFTAYGGSTFEWNQNPLFNSNSITMTSDSTTNETNLVVSLFALNESTNCSMLIYDTVVVMPYPIIDIMSEQDTLCVGDNIALTVEGDARRFVWTTGDTSRSIQISPENSTVYQVNAYSDFNCMSSASHYIVVNSLPPVFDIELTDTSLCYDGTVNVTIYPSFSNMEYYWSYPGLGTSTPQFTYHPLQDIPYSYTDTLTVDLVNLYGCHRQGQALITVHPMPREEITAPSGLCVTDTIMMTLSGNYFYHWYQPITQEQSSNDTVWTTQLQNTTYRVKATTEYGCYLEVSKTVETHQLPTVSIRSEHNSNYFCDNESYILIASGAQDYVWSNGQVGDHLLITPPLSPNYQVIGTDEHGCRNSTGYTLNINPSPNIELSLSSDTVCAGGNVTISAIGDFESIVWSNGSTTYSIVTPYLYQTQQYSVLVGNTAHNVSCYTRDTVEVIVMVVPTLSVQNSSSPICANDTGFITVTGADSYEWTPNAILSGNSDGSATVHPVSSVQDHTEIFTVTGFLNEFGCNTSLQIPYIIHALPDINITATSEGGHICLGDSLSLMASGGISYSWYEDGSTNIIGNVNVITISPTQTTDYTIQAMNPHGCYDREVFTVTVHEHPEVNIFVSDSAICRGDTVQLNISSNGHQYAWDNFFSLSAINIANPLASPQTTCLYTVQVTDTTTHCKTVDSVKITVHQLPVLHSNAPHSMCLGDSLVIDMSGAVEYQWFNNDKTNLIYTGNPYPSLPEELPSARYQVVGTDEFGCKSDLPIEVMVYPLPQLDVNVSYPGFLCNNGSNFLGITVQSNIFSTNYQWSSVPADNTIVSDGQVTFVSPDTNTTYFIRGYYAIDGVICSAVDTEFVQVFPVPVIHASVEPEIACLHSEAELSATGARRYMWFLNNQMLGNSQTITHVAEQGQQYIVMGIDTNNCIGTDTLNIQVIDIMPQDSVRGPRNTCANVPVTVRTSGLNQCDWYPNIGLSEVSDSSVTITLTESQTYVIRLTNEYGCVDSMSFHMNVYPVPELNMPHQVEICQGNDFSFRVSGASSYIWEDGSTNDFRIVTPDTTSVYTVTSFNQYHCQTIDSIKVVVFPMFDLHIVASRDSFCLEDNAITLMAYGAGDTYEWSTGSRDSVITVYPTASTTYTLTAVNTSVNCITTAEYPIVRMPDPVFNILPYQEYICKNDSIELFVSNQNYTNITWNTLDTTDRIKVSPSVPTTYTATLTNAYGCHFQAERFVDVKPRPQISILADETVVCFGEQIRLKAVGNAASYQWSTGHVGDSLVINQLTNGQYKVTAYSEFLCTASDSIDIAIYPIPDYSIVVPPQTLCVGDTAQISISGQNDWIWSPMTGIIYHDNSRTLVQPEVTTDYVGRIVNQYGCIDSVSVHINVYPPLPLQLTPDTAICLGESLILTASGAWNYLWSNGETNSSFTITPTESTTYSVSSIDEHGCVTTKHSEIQVKPDFNLNLMVTKDTICVGDSTTIWYYGSADQYTWSTGSTGTHIVEHPAITSVYSLHAYNSLTGCAKNASTTIVVLPYPQILLQSPLLVCPDDTIHLAVSSTYPFSYQWSSNPEGSIISATDSAVITATPPQSSYYILTSSNQFCEVQDSLLVETSELPGITINNIHDETCEGRNGSIGIDIQTDFPPVTLQWSNGYNTNENQIFNLSAGIYNVTATDNMGCSQTLYGIEVDNITPPEIEIVNIESVLNINDGVVTLQVSHYYGNYTIEWFSDPDLMKRMDEYTNQLSVSGLVAGDYWILITDEACSTLQEVHIPRVNGGEGTFYVPNSFTPSNHDGINDYFSIYFSGEIQFQEIVIYSRWGELVFQSNDSHFKWDGSYNGKTTRYGIYNYVIFYTDGTGHENKKIGTVTVF